MTLSLKNFNVINSGAMDPNKVQPRIDGQKCYLKNLTAPHSHLVPYLNTLKLSLLELGFTFRFFQVFTVKSEDLLREKYKELMDRYWTDIFLEIYGA